MIDCKEVGEEDGPLGAWDPLRFDLMRLLFEMELELVFYARALFSSQTNNSRVLVQKLTKPKTKIINNEFSISVTKNIPQWKTYTEKRGE
jgi:hypothetical protein